jgi:hypothetical protein
MKMSGVSVGLAWLSHFNPVFLPAILLVFTYSAFPYSHPDKFWPKPQRFLKPLSSAMRKKILNKA